VMTPERVGQQNETTAAEIGAASSARPPGLISACIVPWVDGGEAKNCNTFNAHRITLPEC
jgi:hypothetical protein